MTTLHLGFMKHKIPLHIFNFNEFYYEVLAKTFENNWLIYLFTGKKTNVKYYIRAKSKLYFGSDERYVLINDFIGYEKKYSIRRIDLSSVKCSIVYWNNPSEPEKLITRAKMALFNKEDEHLSDLVVFSSDDIRI